MFGFFTWFMSVLEEDMPYSLEQRTLVLGLYVGTGFIKLTR
jgi:hypothetical protein